MAIMTWTLRTSCLFAGVGFGIAMGSIVASPAAAQSADNPHGPLEVSCGECHSVESWTSLREPVIFDHSMTGFPLELGHRAISCLTCHGDLVFSFVATACADCHEDPHEGDLGAGCELCHAPAAWNNRSEIADRHASTLLPLTGAHANADCASCHRLEPPFEFAGTPTDCVVCHGIDYQETTRPNHIQVDFSTNCRVCHGTRTWTEAHLEGGPLFDHSAFFPLVDAHAIASCEACHQTGQFSNTPNDCFSCHQADFEGTTRPDHLAAGFPTACETCHTERQWEGATFDHDALFRLIGAHRTASCESCHQNGQYQGTPRDCASCHQADYNATADPNHRAVGFPTTCKSCHGTSQWEGATFDHDALFRLTGAHRMASCESCHQNGQYQGTPRDCFSCHAADYNATLDPNHLAAGFPTTCEACHGTNQWEGATFDHDTFFQLTGAHRMASCESCHQNGQYQGTPRDCFSCHVADYNATLDPNHLAAGFPTTCEACHGTNQWEGATFDHDTFFQLTGAHRNAPCESCHQNGLYQGTPRDCFSCHATEYNATLDPNHLAAGFPTTCEACHGTNQWEGATFDHDTFFQLTGAHRTASCESCHQNGQYQGTPRDCFSCHAAEYNATDDPNHLAAGFPTTCEACHGTNRWDDATFNHTFDIDRGAHGGLACSECHVVPGNLQVFECILCHEHRQSETNDEHSDVPGYVWDSLACYSCHPTGRD